MELLELIFRRAQRVRPVQERDEVGECNGLLRLCVLILSAREQ